MVKRGLLKNHVHSLLNGINSLEIGQTLKRNKFAHFFFKRDFDIWKIEIIAFNFIHGIFSENHFPILQFYLEIRVNNIQCTIENFLEHLKHKI